MYVLIKDMYINHYINMNYYVYMCVYKYIYMCTQAL